MGREHQQGERLSDCGCGDFEILALGDMREGSRRLAYLERGFTPSTKVRLLKKSAGLFYIELRGARFALRKESAEAIRVSPLAHAPREGAEE